MTILATSSFHLPPSKRFRSSPSSSNLDKSSSSLLSAQCVEQRPLLSSHALYQNKPLPQNLFPEKMATSSQATVPRQQQSSALQLKPPLRSFPIRPYLRSAPIPTPSPSPTPRMTLDNHAENEKAYVQSAKSKYARLEFRPVPISDSLKSKAEHFTGQELNVTDLDPLTYYPAQESSYDPDGSERFDTGSVSSSLSSPPSSSSWDDDEIHRLPIKRTIHRRRHKSVRRSHCRPTGFSSRLLAQWLHWYFCLLAIGTRHMCLTSCTSFIVWYTGSLHVFCLLQRLTVT